MKELVQYAFDFFAYVIPGLFVIFSLSLIAVPVDSLEQAINKTKDFSAEIVTVLVIASFVIGFIIYPIGRKIYKTFGFIVFSKLLIKDENDNKVKVSTKDKVLEFIIYPIVSKIHKTFDFKIFPKLLNKYEDKVKAKKAAKTNDDGLSLNAKYSLIRELSPTNFKYVETWNIYCAMAHNLMVASLVFTIVSIIKIFKSNDAYFWLGSSAMGVLIFLILTHRAVTYSQWAKGDINATIDSLNLEEKQKVINANSNDNP